LFNYYKHGNIRQIFLIPIFNPFQIKNNLMRKRLTSNLSIESILYLISTYEIKKIFRLQLETYIYLYMNTSYTMVIGVALREKYRGKEMVNRVSVVSAREYEKEIR